MDSVEFICSPLFFPNPPSQPLLTLCIFHPFPRSPLLPFGSRAITVSVLFFSRVSRGSRGRLVRMRRLGRKRAIKKTQCEFNRRSPIREHEYSFCTGSRKASLSSSSEDILGGHLARWRLLKPDLSAAHYCLQKNSASGTLATQQLKFNKKRKTLKAPKAAGGVCSHSCVALFLGCVSCCEVTGSVIGPRGFYLAVLTGHVSDFLFFFFSSFPFSLKSTWPHWPFRAHYRYFYKSVSTVMKARKKKKKAEYIFFLFFCSPLIIRQTFVSGSVRAISMHITKGTDACSFCIH